jgi:short-subunit dehydrogenase
MVSVITGASSGIGHATARLFAERHGTPVVLVARRADRLRDLAARLGRGSTWIALDLTDEDAPARLRAHVEEHHGGAVRVLVNNAGASWRATFADGGWENVRRHMAPNFDAQVRVTEALLPLLRRSAPSSIVNVSSTAGRVARGGSGAYSASKFALAGWSDALAQEEAPHGVHVGLVLPGFIETEGFPARELLAGRATRWLVSTPDKAAEAIADCAFGGRHERYVPRPYALAAALRLLAPGVIRLAAGRGAMRRLVTRTGADEAEEPRRAAAS